MTTHIHIAHKCVKDKLRQRYNKYNIVFMQLETWIVHRIFRARGECGADFAQVKLLFVWDLSFNFTENK
jgi:hypothetical protein